jgi:hypothetical protein
MAKNTVATTQQHLDIEDVQDGIVILKSGTAAAVLQTTAINFDLLSEQEQDWMIGNYAALLNSLTYPIQILVRSKRVNVTNYLSRLNEAEKATQNPSLAGQIERYKNFISEWVSKNQVLDKRFYVIVPYFATPTAQVKGVVSLFGKKQAVPNKWVILEKAKPNLATKVDHLIKQFGRVNIRAIPLNSADLVEMLYDIYNPQVGREQKVALATKEYMTPIVQPHLVEGGEEAAK